MFQQSGFQSSHNYLSACTCNNGIDGIWGMQNVILLRKAHIMTA